MFSCLWVVVIILHIFPPLLLPAIGAAYGTAKSGVGISAMAVMRPDLIMKSVIPVVMAGIVGIYGLVVSVVIANTSKYQLRVVTPVHVVDNVKFT